MFGCQETYLFSKCSLISDNSVVGFGSVVTKKFKDSNVILAEVPARVVKCNINWDRCSIKKFEQMNFNK